MKRGDLIGKGAQADVLFWEPGKVLKLYKTGTSQSHVESEALHTELLHAAGLSVPRAFGVLTVDGRFGVILENIDGGSLQQKFLSRPWSVPPYARRMAELHAEMHSKHLENVPDVRDRLKRQIDRSIVLPQHMKDWASAKLRETPGGDSLLHLDFHPGNVLEKQGALYVIDWESPCKGDPLADVARTCLLSRQGRYHLTGFIQSSLAGLFGNLFCREYLKHYEQITRRDMSMLDTWLPIVAAARTHEGFRPEVPALLRIVAMACR